MLSPPSDVLANITLAHLDAVGRGHPLHHFSAEINTILMSGPAFERDNNSTAAAVLVAQVEDFSEMMEVLNKGDPYVSSRVYSKTWLYEWRSSHGSLVEFIADEENGHLPYRVNDMLLA
jgi:uncharacterized protein YciI